MKILKLSNFFSPEDILSLKQTIQEQLHASSNPIPEAAPRYHGELGRLEMSLTEALGHLIPILEDLVNSLDIHPTKLTINWPPIYVEYNSKYGDPTLPPHYDGDFNDIIIDYQLTSSEGIWWPLGVNLSTYPLEDNEALIFNPNLNIHWRPHKHFQPGEYVHMLFFRFCNADPSKRSDYSYLPGNQQDPAFKEVATLRDSL